MPLQTFLPFLVCITTVMIGGSGATTIKVYQSVHPMVGNTVGPGRMKLVHDKPEDLRDMTVCLRFLYKVININNTIQYRYSEIHLIGFRIKGIFG